MTDSSPDLSSPDEPSPSTSAAAPEHGFPWRNTIILFILSFLSIPLTYWISGEWNVVLWVWALATLGTGLLVGWSIDGLPILLRFILALALALLMACGHAILALGVFFVGCVTEIVRS